jgi:hypothetical protein
LLFSSYFPSSCCTAHRCQRGWNCQRLDALIAILQEHAPSACTPAANGNGLLLLWDLQSGKGPVSLECMLNGYLQLQTCGLFTQYMDHSPWLEGLIINPGLSLRVAVISTAAVLDFCLETVLMVTSWLGPRNSLIVRINRLIPSFPESIVYLPSIDRKRQGAPGTQLEPSNKSQNIEVGALN